MSFANKLANIDTKLKNVLSDINIALSHRGAEEVTTLNDVPTAIGSITDEFGTSYVNTSKITDYSYFFYGNARLELLPYIDTRNGTNFNSMFEDSTSLTTIPQLDTSNGVDFGGMFYDCNNLIAIPPINTSNGTNFNSMFHWCNSLTTIPQLDTSKATHVNNMFSYCGSLTTIPQLDFRSVLPVDLNTFAFLYCGALKNISFVVQTIKYSLTFRNSPRLTIESAKSILLGLYNYSGTDKEYSYTITLSTETVALLEADGNTAPNGMTWAEYVMSIGWNM